MPKKDHAEHSRRTRVPLAVLLTLCALNVFAQGSRPTANATTHAKSAATPPARTTQKQPAAKKATERAYVPRETLLQIIEAEDERRWDASELGKLLTDSNPAVRRRAALAAGRIGDEGAVAPLAAMLRADADDSARVMAAFALGEIEAGSGADALTETLRLSKSAEVRARAVEALGKIAAALPEAQSDAKKRIGEAILNTLAAEGRLSKPNRALILLGLTAVLRAKPDGGARAVASFLSSADARVREDAANTLTRMRAKEGLERLRLMLANDTDAISRANAARALGAAEDAAAFDTLLLHATTDADARVRVSSIRALAQLKNARAAEALVKRGEELFTGYKSARAGATANPSEVNELLEIATTLGRVLPNANDERAVAFLRGLREAGVVAPEVEQALARIAPTQYVRDRAVTEFVAHVASVKDTGVTWQKVSATGQGLGELASVTSAQVGNSVVTIQADAQLALRSLAESKNTPALAVPDILRALAAFKPLDLAALARAQLKADDVIVRATAADLLADLPPDADNSRALAEALPRALEDTMNDAALSILGALSKQAGAEATAAIERALEVSDYLVRRRAADILRERAGASRQQERRVETVNTSNHREDYERAAARAGKSVRAVVSTDKGAFTIELLAEDAPLTVDNFVQLARRNYFNGITFHRVVPNFVIQGGDPRGDGNGGPGYQIRCEINMIPYTRGAVGMALSGKDTGGSQWFVTHSPQPHLDGGYTVFGRVVAGMDVVDRIARGDRIRAITITETKSAQK